jgi:SAM-dependent methyltransferase
MTRVKINNNPWMVDQVASTQGLHYLDQDNNITHYPQYNLPVPAPKKENALMLEIGSGWGRWMVAGSKKGYIPLALDFDIRHIKSVHQTVKDHGLNAYGVVSDMQNVPFKDGIFDLIWSFSAMQHVHRNKLLSCLGHVNRVLNKDGFALLEFPNRNGIHNRMGKVEQERPFWNELNHMAVRYYTLKEYEEMFKPIFGNFKAEIHSMLGIGVLPDDLGQVTWKNKPLVALSLLTTAVAKVIPGFKGLADSFYIRVKRNVPVETPQAVLKFIEAHKTGYDNRNIAHLLQCPLTGTDIVFNDDKTFLVSAAAGRRFPIIDGIPVMLPDYSEQL